MVKQHLNADTVESEWVSQISKIFPTNFFVFYVISLQNAIKSDQITHFSGGKEVVQQAVARSKVAFRCVRRPLTSDQWD